MSSDAEPSRTKVRSAPRSGRWESEGSFVPLFIKLQDLNPDENTESPPLRTFSVEDLQRSVITEIQNLLNTRVKLPKNFFETLIQDDSTKGFPELYGLPDFSFFDVTNQGTWENYAFLIKYAITRYEPRLTNIFVKLQHFDDATQTLSAAIKGDLLINNVVQSFSFSVTLTKPSS